MAVVGDDTDDEEGEAPLGDLVGGIHPDDDGAIHMHGIDLELILGWYGITKHLKWKYECLLSHHASLLRGLMD